MNNHSLTLTDKKVLAETRTRLEQEVPLRADGYECSTIEAVCQDWAGTPVGNTIRGYLNEQLCVEELPNSY